MQLQEMRPRKCDTLSAKFQSEESGLVDGVGTEDEILGQIRSLVCMLPTNNEDDASYDECLDDLNRVCEGIENAVEDTSIVLTLVSDDNIFFETKKRIRKRYGDRFYPLEWNDNRSCCKSREDI